MSDIVEKLHSMSTYLAADPAQLGDDWLTANEAAAEITALRAALSAKDEEVKRLREALAEAKAAILVADVMDARHNAAGYLTDRALWHDRAMTIIETALSPRTAAMEHIAQELAEEIEEETL